MTGIHNADNPINSVHFIFLLSVLLRIFNIYSSDGFIFLTGGFGGTPCLFGSVLVSCSVSGSFSTTAVPVLISIFLDFSGW